MRPVKLFAGMTAFLIAASAAALYASADEGAVQDELFYERGIVLEQPPEDDTDSIAKEPSDSKEEAGAEQNIFTAAITAAAEPNTHDDENDNSSAGAPAGIAVALAAVACTIVGVSKRK